MITLNMSVINGNFRGQSFNKICTLQIFRREEIDPEPLSGFWKPFLYFLISSLKLDKIDFGIFIQQTV